GDDAELGRWPCAYGRGLPGRPAALGCSCCMGSTGAGARQEDWGRAKGDRRRTALVCTTWTWPLASERTSTLRVRGASVRFHPPMRTGVGTRDGRGRPSAIDTEAGRTYDQLQQDLCNTDRDTRN